MRIIAFTLSLLIFFSSCSTSPARGSSKSYSKKSPKEVWRTAFIKDCTKDLFKSKSGCTCVADDLTRVMSKSYSKYSVEAIKKNGHRPSSGVYDYWDMAEACYSVKTVRKALRNYLLNDPVFLPLFDKEEKPGEIAYLFKRHKSLDVLEEAKLLYPEMKNQYAVHLEIEKESKRQEKKKRRKRDLRNLKIAGAIFLGAAIVTAAVVVAVKNKKKNKKKGGGSGGYSPSYSSSPTQSYKTSLCPAGSIWVKGRYNDFYTWVKGHCRTEANDTCEDNWSTKGNTNPVTGKKGRKKCP